MTFGAPDVHWGADGLVPAIVQDEADRRLLMLAWMDAEALAATLDTGEVHFHSRSRNALWRKGETSGNVLRLRGLALDCDADALLVTVSPTGPACHRRTRSCFDAGGVDDRSGASEGGSPTGDATAGRPPQGFAWLETLWATVASRAADRPDGSYTARLVEGGVDRAGRKVVEEATEVLIAAKDDAAVGGREAGGEVGHDAGSGETRRALAGEAADLLYHLLVLLAERDIPPADVLAVLRGRHRRTAPGGQAGFEATTTR